MRQRSKIQEELQQLSLNNGSREEIAKHGQMLAKSAELAVAIQACEQTKKVSAFTNFYSSLLASITNFFLNGERTSPSWKS